MESATPTSPFRVLALLAACCVAGCGEADGRVAVGGDVRVDGEPLRDGSISFLPIAGTDGPSATAKVVDGRFDIPRTTGPAPGRYRVIVQVGDLTGGAARGPGSDGRLVPLGQRFEQEVETGEDGSNDLRLHFSTSDGNGTDAETDP